jgi:hypothetical protein
MTISNITMLWKVLFRFIGACGLRKLNRLYPPRNLKINIIHLFLGCTTPDSGIGDMGSLMPPFYAIVGI